MNKQSHLTVQCANSNDRGQIDFAKETKKKNLSIFLFFRGKEIELREMM